MVNNSFNIVSYLSNQKGTEKTSLVYDTINKRVIEKWVSYQVVNDESKFVITDRLIYVYNKLNIISKILEIEKGYDDREYSFLNDDNEYCHSINRNLNRIELNNKIITQITYTRINHIGPKGKKVFLKNLTLVTEEVENRVFKTRIKYILKKGKIYIYNYKKNNFCHLNNIVEYKVLVDFRFINRLINKTGIPILMTIPDLFLKSKTKNILNISDSGEKRLKYNKQDYFSRNYLNNDNYDFFIQNLVLIEDIFIKETSEIHEKYNKLK